MRLFQFVLALSLMCFGSLSVSAQSSWQDPDAVALEPGVYKGSTSIVLPLPESGPVGPPRIPISLYPAPSKPTFSGGAIGAGTPQLYFPERLPPSMVPPEFRE